MKLKSRFLSKAFALIMALSFVLAIAPMNVFAAVLPEHLPTGGVNPIEVFFEGYDEGSGSEPLVTARSYNARLRSYTAPAVPGYSDYGYKWLQTDPSVAADRATLLGLYEALGQYCAIAHNSTENISSLSQINVSSLNLPYSTQSENLIKLAAAIFQADNPQYYFISGGYGYSMSDYGSGWMISGIRPYLNTDYDTYETRQRLNQVIETKYAEYASLVNNVTSDYDKARLVHDKILAERDYAYKNGVPDNSSSAHTIIGVMDTSTNGPVCESYSKSYAYILHRMGIDALYITGLGGGGAHAWNMVKLNGNWYYCDATWDDRETTDNDPGNKKNDLYYMYYMVGTNNTLFHSEHAAGNPSGLYNWFNYGLPSAPATAFDPNGSSYSFVTDNSYYGHATWSNGGKYVVKGNYVIGYSSTFDYYRNRDNRNFGTYDIPKSGEIDVTGIQMHRFTYVSGSTYVDQLTRNTDFKVVVEKPYVVGDNRAWVYGLGSTYRGVDFGWVTLKDTVAPILSNGSVNRSGDTAASIGFTTDEDGTAYYQVVLKDAAAPSVANLASWTSLGSVTAGAISGKSVVLTAGDKDIYVLVVDGANNKSNLLKISTTSQTVIPVTTAAISVAVPVQGATPSTTATGTGKFTVGPVSWSPTHSPFQGATEYTASVMLTVNAGYTFTGLSTATINGQTATIENNTGSTVTLSYKFPATGLTPITVAAISVTAPVQGVAPSTNATGTGDFTVDTVTWSPEHNPFQGATEYTTTVTITANTGYTFTGLSNATINSKNATIVNNTGSAVTLSYKFPATEATPITAASVSVTAPVQGAIPSTDATGTGNFTLGTVSWSPVHSTFQGATEYTATVILTANAGNTFTGLSNAKINGQDATISNNIGSSVMLSYKFPATGQTPIISAALSVTPPVQGATPSAIATGTGSFTIEPVTWSPAHNPFHGTTEYTATITLKANAGYTFTGLSTATINSQTATIVDNTSSAVTLSYKFPATDATPIKSAAISVTVPVQGLAPSPNATGAGNFTIGTVTWSPQDNPFKGATEYSATLTLTANEGYTFTGLSTATINGQIATITNNTGSAVTLSYKFPATGATSITSAAILVTAPVQGIAPSPDATGTGNFTVGSVTWTPTHNPFQGAVEYIATVTLTANTGYTFTGLSTATINGQAAMIANNTGSAVTLSYKFPVTAATSITTAEISVTTPVQGAAPSAEATGTGNFTVGAVTWSPTHNPFKGATEYTATVTLTANTGFTFTGLSNATINDQEATIANNIGTAVTLSYKFPATGSTPIISAAISVTAPVQGAAPSAIATGTGSFTIDSVIWSPTHNPFQGVTEYTASVTLMANAGYSFTGLSNATINGQTAIIANNTGPEVTLTYKFPATDATPIMTAAISVAVPVQGIAPNTTATGTGNFTLGDVIWSPTHDLFQGATEYTATVTLTANAGYTFTGLSNAVINGQIANITNNIGTAVTLSYKFPATGATSIESAAISVTAPVQGAAPSTVATGTGSFVISAVTWSPTHDPFQSVTEYTVSVALTANAGYMFTGLLNATINGQAATIANNAGSAVTLTYKFPATEATPITAAAISVTAPVQGIAPSTTATGTGSFSLGTVTWSPAHNPFQGATKYTASVTLTANAGYTFTGLSTATINSQTATITNNTGSAVTLSYEFPATESTPITSAAISVTAPVLDVAPSTIATGTGSFTIGTVSWSPDHNPFKSVTEYTVSVALTANAGYSFTGLTNATINGQTATIADNTGSSVTLSYKFPATGTTPIMTAAISVAVPVQGAVPSTTATGTGNFTLGDVQWTPVHDTFQGATEYTATVTLTANDGYTFTGLLTAIINSQNATISNNTGSAVTLSYKFPATGATSIESAAISVTAPVQSAVPSTIATGTGSFTIGAVTWSPDHNPFKGVTEYTASVTLTANDGYTFIGLSTATINGRDATIENNIGSAVTLTYKFPATEATPITAAAISVTYPVPDVAPSTIATGTGNFTIGAVIWSPAHNPFQAGIEYTASVTLTANAGYTFAGLSTATINDQAATISNNTGSAVTLSSKFMSLFEGYMFTDINGNKLEKLTAPSLVTTLYRINKTQETENLNLVVAIYTKDGKLLHIGSSEKTIDVGDIQELRVSLDLPANADGSYVTKGYYANVFLWDSTTYVPVAEKFVFK